MRPKTQTPPSQLGGAALWSLGRTAAVTRAWSSYVVVKRGLYGVGKGGASLKASAQ